MVLKRYSLVLALVVSLILVFMGCQRTYYSFWEKMGKEKRHLLRDQIKKATVEQEEASEQFQDTLSQIKAMYGFDGGELEKVYDELKADYEECLQRSEDVHERIENVARIADDLFDEWEAELSEITNDIFRERSKESLETTKTRFARLHLAMKKAEDSMAPVIANLKDYVLYLKHNLNAQAVGALKGEADHITEDISKLIRDMKASIREAEAFLEEFK